MPQVLHNALRRITALQRAFRVALGANDDPGFRGIERAGETLTPVIDLWRRPEWAALRGEIPFAAFHSQGQVAGEMTFVGLRNPVGSGGIAVVELHTLFDTTPNVDGQLFHGVISATSVQGAEQVVARDTRFNLAGATPLFKIHGNGAAAVGNNALTQIRIPNTPDYQLALTHILTPGFEMRWYATTLATILRVGLYGYFRPATPEELAQIQG